MGCDFMQHRTRTGTFTIWPHKPYKMVKQKHDYRTQVCDITLIYLLAWTALILNQVSQHQAGTTEWNQWTRTDLTHWNYTQGITRSVNYTLPGKLVVHQDVFINTTGPQHGLRLTLTWSSMCVNKQQLTDHKCPHTLPMLTRCMYMDCEKKISNKDAHIYNGNYDDIPQCGICNITIQIIDNALQCDTCESWIHSTCVNVNAQELEMLESTDIPFLCPACEWDDNCALPFTDASIDLGNSFQLNPELVTDPERPIQLEPPQSGGLSVAHLNINGLMVEGRMDQFQFVMEKEPFDIIGISESKLNNTISDEEIMLNGYSTIRKDRLGRGGGGVTIYIKDSINYVERPDLVPMDIEGVCAEVILSNAKHILILTIYRPPDLPVAWFDTYNDFLNGLFRENKETIICGDLNCDLLKHPPDNHTKHLIYSCEIHQLTQLIDRPTRITPNSQTLIDVILTTNPENISTQETLHTGLADHQLVYCVTSSHKARPQGIHRTIKARNFKKFNEETFLKDLSECPWSSLEAYDDIDDAYHHWKTLFLDICDKHCPVVTKRVRKTFMPWIDQDIKNEIRLKHHYYDKAKETNLSVHWIMYKTLRNRVSNMMKRAKRIYYTNMILENKYKPQTMWKYLKELLPGKSKATPKGLIVDGELITDKMDMANIFNRYFTSVGEELAMKIPPTAQCNINTPTDVPTFTFPCVTSDFVEKHLKNLPVNKATGLDMISGKLLRLAAPAIASPIANLFNTSLRTGKFPSEWKTAKILPIYKSGSRNDTNNYRPISILPILSKVLERFVHSHFSDFLEKNHLMTLAQSGF